MWLCLNNAFLSIVHKECAADEVLVRARRKGDIEKVFPAAKVIDSWGTDYQFRAVVKRTEFAAVLAGLADTVTYPNFKGSTKDRNLHDAYASFWHQHARLQPRAPYSQRRGANRGRGGQAALI